MYLENFKHLLLKKFKKTIVQKFICMKNKFGQKDKNFFSKAILLAHFISFVPSNIE
jgi:hypothetical protein